MDSPIRYLILIILLVLMYVFSYLFLLYYEKTGLLKETKKECIKKFFLFGPIYFVVLFNKQKSNTSVSETSVARLNKIKSYISLALSMICLFSFISIPVSKILDAYSEPPYYDLYQNKYDSHEDVIFYSKDGKKYKFMTIKNEEDYIIEGDDIFSQFCFYDIEHPEKYINTRNCFIDEKGYFTIIDADKLTFDEARSHSDNPYFWCDAKGKYYAPASTSYWNENGDLVPTIFDVEK